MAAKHKIMSVVERVDRAGELQSKIKPLEKEFKDLKSQIRNIMEDNEYTTLEGTKYEVLLSGGEVASIDPYELYQFLKEKNELGKFWDCISVRIKDAETGLADVATLNELDSLKKRVPTTKRMTIKEK